MVPIHSMVGTTTFILAITTAIAGITETAFYKLRLVLSLVTRCTDRQYFSSEGKGSAGLGEEAIFLNTIGVILIALAVVMPVIIGCGGLRRGLVREGD